MIAVILILFLSALVLILSYVLYRFALRLLQYDDLWQLLVDEIDTNVRYFEKLKDMPLISDTNEVTDAHRNMQIMRQRLEEYSLRMEEHARRPLRKPRRPGPPPVVR
jgi:hypothetical protein